MADKETCLHPAFFANMCVTCGILKKDISSGPAFTMNGGKTLHLSKEEANYVQSMKIRYLKDNRKLALVLDLDHTLLHAVQIDGQTPQQTVQSNGEIHHLPIEEIVGGTIKHLVMKKRPHLDSFLVQAQEFCQMSVYTAGTRRYAEAVVKVIDPERKYISDRIVSRSDGQPARADNIDKSLEKIFLQDTSLAVILDDREDVWKGSQSEQLLCVRPYVYFYSGSLNSQMVGATGSVSEVNNQPGSNHAGPSQQQQLSAPCPVIMMHGDTPGKVLKMAPVTSPEYTESDDQLLRCMDILRSLHAKVFPPPPEPGQPIPSDEIQNRQNKTVESVPRVLREMRRKVLAGCTLSFSGLIPTNEARPRAHVLWRLAEYLGAQVSLDLLPRTTHLLSSQVSTKKVSSCLQLRSLDVWVLHPDWLFYCRWCLARADESTFMLTGLAPGQPFPSPKMDYSVIDHSMPRSDSDSVTLANTLINKNNSSNTASTASSSTSSLNGQQSNKRKHQRDEEGRTSEDVDDEAAEAKRVRYESLVDEDLAVDSGPLPVVCEEEDLQLLETQTQTQILEEAEEAEEEKRRQDDEGDGDCVAYFEQRIVRDLDDYMSGAEEQHLENQKQRRRKQQQIDGNGHGVGHRGQTVPRTTRDMIKSILDKSSGAGRQLLDPETEGEGDAELEDGEVDEELDDAEDNGNLYFHEDNEDVDDAEGEDDSHSNAFNSCKLTRRPQSEASTSSVEDDDDEDLLDLETALLSNTSTAAATTMTRSHQQKEL